MTDKFKVLVCGGRWFTRCNKRKGEDGYEEALDKALAEENLLDDTLWGIYQKHSDTGILIIQGGAKGADLSARDWAVHHNVEYQQFDADWDEWGIAAGPVRNRRMMNEGKPDLVVAFKGGKGTANMIDIAERFGTEVVKIP